MKLPKFKKKVVASALAAGLAVGAAGTAAAYFLSTTATASGTGKVGTPAHTAVYVHEMTTGPTLVPGGTPQTFTFTVRNKSTKSLTLDAFDTLETATTTGVAVIVTNANTRPVAGCSATWFAVTYSGGATPTPNPFPFALAGHGSYGLVYQLYFLTTATTNQAACATAVPTIHVTVKSST